MKDLICECVADDAEPVLRDILSMFCEETSMGSPYLSLDAFHKVTAIHGLGPVSLILTLLDRSGYVEHYGNLTSSSALTDAGAALRDSLNEPMERP